MIKNIAIALLLISSSEMTAQGKITDWIANTFGKINNDNLLTCTSNVQRLKAGPANVGKVLAAKNQFTDETFKGGSMIQAGGEGGTDNAKLSNTRKLAEINAYAPIRITRWHKIPKYKDFTIFGPNGTPHFLDIKQGSVGNCYFISSVSGLAKYPQYIKNAFVNQKVNKEGIYAIRFFIRGKPWVVSIDDQFLMNIWKETKNTGGKLLPTDVHMNEMVFASGKNGAMWGPLLEKAWSKVKGTYDTSKGGWTSAATKALTGAPVFNVALTGVNNDAQLKNIVK